MNPDLGEFLLRFFCAVGLLFWGALLAAGEFSVIKLRLSHFNPVYLERLKRRKLPAALLEEADRTVRVARFGILVCALGWALLAYPLFKFLIGGVGIWEGWPSQLLAFFVMFAIYYLLGELLPRGLAVASPVRSLRAASVAVQLSGLVGILVVRPFGRLSRFLLKQFGLNSGSEWEALGIEEQLNALKENPDVSQVLLKVIKNALQMREVKALDILLPRNQVTYFDINESNAVNLALAEETEHTRFPLCDGDLDNCLGLIHIKDIFQSKENLESLDLRRIKREMIWVQQEDPLEKILRKLLLRKTHMALVSDEFGGAEGVITLEMILEQLVGEIQDEFDTEEDPIKKLGADEFTVSGLATIRELEETFATSIENKNEVASLGGLITAELGRIPENGEALNLGNLVVTITEVDDTRVIAARVKVLLPFEREEPNHES